MKREFSMMELVPEKEYKWKKDVATRSMNMSEETPKQMSKKIVSVDEEEENDEADLRQFQLRTTWESRYDITLFITGETGCGKTRLVECMRQLQCPIGEEVRNMVLMKVNESDIIRKVEEAEKIAQENTANYGEELYTVLFLNEANTTEAIGLIKEIMCDHAMEGEPLKLCQSLKIVAACNPCRKHSEDLIKRFGLAGLGYQVDAEKTTDRMDRVPKRIVVFRVQPHSQSMLPLVWDFGQLDTNVEEMYIKQMVLRNVKRGYIKCMHRCLDPLPDVTCRSLSESIKKYQGNAPDIREGDLWFDDAEFRSSMFQRSFQYLYRLYMNRGLGDVGMRSTEENPLTCLQTLLKHCGMPDPSWAELCHFVWFFNTQLVDFKSSDYLSHVASEDLSCFPQFVLRFLIQMSRDFATRSLNMSEESPKQMSKKIYSVDEEEENDNAYLRQFQLRTTWKSSPHPYLFFNMKQQTGNLVDAQTGTLLEAGIMQKNLQDALRRNNVPINENLDSLPREDKLSNPCSVIGEDVSYDPDPTYELTTTIRDIYMLFRRSKALIKRFEQAGLGYQVDTEQTTDRIGRVPMMRLVYGEQPLPQSMPHLVWDFGQIYTELKEIYIKQMALINLKIIHDDGSSDADTNRRAMTVERQEIHKNYNCSSYGTKLMISALSFAYTVLPCAGGTDLRRSQLENQDHSQIYQASLKFVSKCPHSSEYINKTLEKCVDVCGSYIMDGNCTYHCMRESSKTRLVEFCAKPKILFGNPDNCLQLLESDVRSGATTLMTETTEMNGGDTQEVWPLQIWSLILLLVVGVIVLAISLACILHNRRHLRAKNKMTKNVETVMQKLVKG